MTFLSVSPSISVRPVPRLALGRLLDTWRQRQALKRLDNHALEDIGLTYRQASAEARRPLWDAPETWIG